MPRFPATELPEERRYLPLRTPAGQPVETESDLLLRLSKGRQTLALYQNYSLYKERCITDILAPFGTKLSVDVLTCGGREEEPQMHWSIRLEPERLWAYWVISGI